MAHKRNRALFSNVTGVPWASSTRTKIGDYAASGNIPRVREILNKGVNTGTIGRANNKNGRAALIRACIADQIHMVENLLSLSAEIECRDMDTGRTPLLWASIANRVEITKLLVKHGANVEVVDLSFLRKPLVWAALANNVSIVQCLLDSGAEIDCVDGGGRTALQWASANGNIDVVKLLLLRGAQLEMRDYRFSHTALVQAAARGHFNCVKALVNAGAEVVDLVPLGLDTLELAMATGNLDLVQYLTQIIDHDTIKTKGDERQCANANFLLFRAASSKGLLKQDSDYKTQEKSLDEDSLLALKAKYEDFVSNTRRATKAVLGRSLTSRYLVSSPN